MKRRISQWLTRYGLSFKDSEGWFNDCDMIDSCVHDLDAEQHRDLVKRMVDDWIREH